MRIVRRITAVLLMALIAASCSGTDDEDNANTQAGQTNTTAAAAGNPNAELKVGAVDDQYILSPTATNDATVGVYPTNANIVEGLVSMSADYKVQPALATS